MTKGGLGHGMRAWLAGAVVCCGAWGCSGGWAGAAIPPEAQKAIDAEDWPGVVAAIGKVPPESTDHEAHFWLGVAIAHDRKPEPAVQHLQAALRLQPDDRGAALWLIRAAVAAEIPWEAEGAVKAFPLDAEVAKQMGLAYIAKHEAAQMYYLDVPSRRNESALNGYLDSAIRYLTRAVELSAGADAEVGRWLGFALSKRGRHEEALPMLRGAIEAGMDAWDVRLDLAVALLRMDRDAEADGQFAAAMELAPKEATNSRGGASRRAAVVYTKGKTQYDTGRYYAAMKTFGELLDLDSAFEGGRHWLGMAAFKAGDYRMAWWAFCESKEVDSVPEDTFMMGRILMVLEQPAAAEKLIAKAMEEVKGQERAVPAEMHYFLGQSQWSQGEKEKKASALKSLDAAHAAQPGNLQYARWAYQCSVENDDPYGALEVCRRLGNAGKYEEAVEGVKQVLAKWPDRRASDFASGRPMPHTRLAAYVLGEIDVSAGRYREAIEHYREGRGLAGMFVRPQAAVALLQAGQAAEAETAFRDCVNAFSKDAYWVDASRLGLGCARIALGKWAEAEAVLAEIKTPTRTRARDVARLWTALHSNGVSLASTADPFTLLGLVEDRAWGAGRGAEVLRIMPGSPLDAVTPKLQARDRLVWVQGLGNLGSEEQMEAFRKGKIPEKPVVGLVVRGRHWFNITIDYATALALKDALTRPPDVQPPGAPKGGQP